MNVLKNINKFSQAHCRSGIFRVNVLRQSTAAASPAAAEPITVPPPEGSKVYSPKIEKIVKDISTLNLLEVSELSQLLKKTLNLPDQPMMPMGGFAMQSPVKNEDEEEAAPKKVQMEFNVRMKSYDEKQKVALIKEIKNCLEGFNLVQAKKFVESLPALVKEKIPKEEAEKLKETLSKVGAEVVIE